MKKIILLILVFVSLFLIGCQSGGQAIGGQPTPVPYPGYVPPPPPSPPPSIAGADLSDYPAPFVAGSQLDGIIVVGSNAPASDVMGALDIAASLQTDTKVTASGSAGNLNNQLDRASALPKITTSIDATVYDFIELINNFAGIKDYYKKQGDYKRDYYLKDILALQEIETTSCEATLNNVISALSFDEPQEPTVFPDAAPIPFLGIDYTIQDVLNTVEKTTLAKQYIAEYMSEKQLQNEVRETEPKLLLKEIQFNTRELTTVESATVYIDGMQVAGNVREYLGFLKMLKNNMFPPNTYIEIQTTTGTLIKSIDAVYTPEDRMLSILESSWNTNDCENTVLHAYEEIKNAQDNLLMSIPDVYSRGPSEQLVGQEWEAVDMTIANLRGTTHQISTYFEIQSVQEMPPEPFPFMPPEIIEPPAPGPVPVYVPPTPTP